jgi:cold shock CspA family protein
MTDVGRGVVESFDEHRGYGRIRPLGEGDALFFHCTAIADGTRSVEVGQGVRFVAAPGHLGRFEARQIEAISTDLRGGSRPTS